MWIILHQLFFYRKTTEFISETLILFLNNEKNKLTSSAQPLASDA